MKTWLFTWNPSRWSWDDLYGGYKEMMHQISQTGKSFATWSCGVNKSITKGDRIFLIRLGEDPRGIVASGYASTSVFEGPHWDTERARKGDTSRRIFIEFDRIVDPSSDEIIPIENLKEQFPQVCWSSQASGIEIPEPVAQSLEDLWYMSLLGGKDICFKRNDYDTWIMARIHHSLLSQIQDSPLWERETIPDIPLTDEQMATFTKGYSPDWDCRYAPYLLGGWYYITRSGHWVKKFKYKKGGDGLYHVTEHYTTGHEKGRNLLMQVIFEGYFQPKISNDKKLVDYLNSISTDKSLIGKYDAITF